VLVRTRGLAFGHLNGEFAHLYRKRYGKHPGPWRAVPFIGLAVWVAAFVIMLARWTP